MDMDSHPLLGWLDYTILGFTLGLSTLVGVYFGFVNKAEKGNKAKAYLDGGQDLKIIPVAISICASTISSIGFLGVASEMYEFGITHLLAGFSYITSAIFAMYIFLPVFYELKVTSVYEYLEMRFSRHVRTLTSIFFISDAIMYSGVVMYVSSVALAKMSGINLHLINFVSCCVCVFYTMVGGIKGVIWTDTIQAWMMVGSMLTIITIGLINVGGISTLADIVVKGDHLRVSWSLSPFLRQSIFAALTGKMWYNAATTFLNQTNVQRFNSLSAYKKVKWTAILVGIGCFVLLTLSHICGLVLYGIYAECDPITTKKIKKPEELVPMFVLDYAGFIPGFPGIFIAGLFSASLSTMSAKLNSVSGVVYNDFIRQVWRDPISDSRAMLLMKSSVGIVGVLCLLMGFLVETMGQVVQVCITLQSICYGALIGLFTLGMLVPKCNTKGAVAGGISGVLAVGWICFGTQRALATGTLKYEKLPVSVEGCTNFTTTPPSIIAEPKEEAFLLYQITFMYYAFIGMLVTVIVGTIVSHFVDPNSAANVPLEYLSPPLRKYLSRKRKPVPVDPIVEMKLLESQRPMEKITGD